MSDSNVIPFPNRGRYYDQAAITTAYLERQRRLNEEWRALLDLIPLAPNPITKNKD